VSGEPRRAGSSPDGVGLVTSARRDRRHQARHPPGEMDQRKHRQHARPAPAPGIVLRLDTRDRGSPARLLPMEPVALPEDVRARPGLSEPALRELVWIVPDGAGERTGGERTLLAL